MSIKIFTELARDKSSKARTGFIDLPHGRIKTPVFMPVGTNATVKAMTKDSLMEIGFEIILANTYHLYLRPGHELIKAAGGLHGFTGWNRNFLTDSGGFQIFSLSKLTKITDEAVQFQSHIDGSRHVISPEYAVDIQTALGSDVFMQLDECTPWGCDEAAAAKAVDRTSLWAARSKARWQETKADFEGKLFGIVQGNFFKHLRVKSAEQISELDFPGLAIGGLSVGEPFSVYAEMLEFTSELLPASKPKYVMGIGTPEYILEAVQNGIDMFDCVFPTRTARNGLLFTQHGTLSIKQARYEKDFSSVDDNCKCHVCTNYSRAYLRHLYKCNEILFSMLASYHNLFFLNDLIQQVHNAIEQNCFTEFKYNFISTYKGNS